MSLTMDRDEPRPPRLTLARLFGIFLRFGLLAFGGPIAQIGMLRAELVDRERWVSRERFLRALAVYQALPGPEAHELCCWFGYRARGRLGALVAGLGFMLPGLAFMLLASWLYVRHGLSNPLVLAAFLGIQPAIAALVLLAVVRIGRHAVRGPWLAAIAAGSAAAAWFDAPFWIPLVAGAAAHALARRPAPVLAALALACGAALAAAWMFGGFGGAPPAVAPPAAAFAPPTLAALSASGLRAGLLTFGGAYTAIPFLRRDAVDAGGWIQQAQFLDGIAIANVLPAPLIVFAAFIGFVPAGWLGALAMAVGVFAPAFAFTIAGHRLFERLVDDPRVHAALDGVAAAVAGLIAATAVEIARASVRGGAAVLIGAGALAVLACWRSRAAVPAVVLVAGAVGAVLYHRPG